MSSSCSTIPSHGLRKLLSCILGVCDWGDLDRKELLPVVQVDGTISPSLDFVRCIQNPTQHLRHWSRYKIAAQVCAPCAGLGLSARARSLPKADSSMRALMIVRHTYKSSAIASGQLFLFPLTLLWLFSALAAVLRVQYIWRGPIAAY